ncbi:MAG TPA: twin-arginine translocase TatA/TatE family subunit [Gemmatimonadales bacterium]
MGFGNFSFWEILLIFVVVLLLFGAKRIPEIAGSMGKGIREFKRSLSDVERSISEPDRAQTNARLADRDTQRDVTAGTAGTAARETEESREPRRLLS